MKRRRERTRIRKNRGGRERKKGKRAKERHNEKERTQQKIPAHYAPTIINEMTSMSEVKVY